MNTNTRYTLKQAQADISELRSDIAGMDSKLDVLIAQFSPAAPAKPAARKARKAAPKPKASTKATKALCKSTRLAFVAAAKREGVDFSNWSTKAIAAACIEEPSLVPSGFRIGEGYKNLLG